jgi:hypothetical protein
MNGKELMENPFKGGDVVAPDKNHALVEIESSRAVMETQSAMVIAKRFPRNQIEAMDRILNACTRQTLAESALYTYARGGTDITGPSIRLAEAIAQNWCNISFGIRELEQANGNSTVEAFAWDLETNTKQVKIFQVAHKRYTKKGTYQLSDPRDVYELVANQGARRLRACILGIIPGDVVESAVKQCEITLKTKAEVTPERIASLVEKFSEYGVTKKQIEERIQRRVDAITPAQVVSLGKIYNSMKDGMSSAGDWFQVEAVQEENKAGTSALKAKLKSEKQVIPEVQETTEAKEPQEKQNIPDTFINKEKPQVVNPPDEAKNVAETEVKEQVIDESSDQKRIDDHFRQKWVNLQKPGFADFVHKNHMDFANVSDEVKAEARAKWAKFYPTHKFPKCIALKTEEPPVEAGPKINLADHPDYKEYLQGCKIDPTMASKARTAVMGKDVEPQTAEQLITINKEINRILDEAGL